MAQQLEDALRDKTAKQAQDIAPWRAEAAAVETETAKQYELRILRRKQVEARTGLSRSTIYNRVAEGTFPAPIGLGSRAVGWIEAEISAWLADRIAASRKAAA